MQIHNFQLLSLPKDHGKETGQVQELDHEQDRELGPTLGVHHLLDFFLTKL